ncbi:MAG: hypothetical protein WKH68_11080 [Candidatus Limnocylindria bacterium]
MAVKSAPRPELAHAKAMRIDLAEVVGWLSELLGAKLVAYLGSVKETRAVSQWARDERGCSAQTERRLRLALQVVLMVEQADGAEVARAWLVGMDPGLDDEAPAKVIRDGDLDAAGPQVVGAARAFLATG